MYDRRFGTLSFVLLTVVAAQVLLGVGAGTALASSPDASSQALADDRVAQTATYGRGSPELVAVLADPVVRPGSSPTVEVGLLNEGGFDLGGSVPDQRITTARAVAVSAKADNALTVESGSVPVGVVTTQQTATAPIELTVPDDVEPGEYDLDLEVTYTYTSFVSPNGNVVNEETRTEDLTVTVIVDDGPRFEIIDATTDAQVGGTGDVSVTIRNTGDEIASAARVVASAAGGAVSLGEAGEAIGYVGEWEPAENKTVTFESTVAEQFSTGGYVLEATVQYADANGLEETAPTARTGVFPAPEQTFSIENVSGTLEVGYEGRITATVRNDGPRSVTDGVVVIDSISDRVSIDERRYALPTLAPNESAQISYSSDVSGQADPGPRQVRFTVEYDPGNGMQSVEETDRVIIEPRTPEFALEVENATVAAGETRPLVVTVTNQRPSTLSSIRANLYADTPVTIVDDEAYIDELEPGESTDVRFEVRVGGEAMPKTYPMELDFRYEDTARNDRISDVYDTPLEVTAPVDSGGRSPLLVGGIVVVFLSIAAILWYRRR